MNNSGLKINYDLRPSKNIERKVLLEILKELYNSFDLDNLAYIGMGSFYFTDFSLFHRELNIQKMYSIEGDFRYIARNEYNKPFSCIEVLKGTTTEQLPLIDWGKEEFKHIVWLDYDGSLKPEIMIDLETVFRNISPGSFFCVTIQSELHKYVFVKDGKKIYDIISFRNDFGEHLLKTKTIKADLAPKNRSKLLQNLIINKINEVLKLREEKNLSFQQLVFFSYKDGAPMITIGGILDYHENNENLNQYNFFNKEYIQTSENSEDIKFPLLTKKEIHLLNSCLPCKYDEIIDELIDKHGLKKVNTSDPNMKECVIDKDSLKSYIKYYRYFPHYTETLI